MGSDTPDSSPPRSAARLRRQKCKPPKFYLPMPVVTIIVGPEQQKFIVHKPVICHRSVFFDGAFNGKFLEGETQTMTLPDVDPSLFGAVVHWCYQEKIDEMQQDENGNIVAIKEGRLVVLGKMWMLGQRFMMTAFQNKVMGRLRSKVCIGAGIELKDFGIYAWESGSELLRKLAVERFATMTEEKVFSSVVDDLPPQLWLEVLKQMKQYYCCLTSYDQKKVSNFEENYKIDTIE